MVRQIREPPEDAALEDLAAEADEEYQDLHQRVREGFPNDKR